MVTDRSAWLSREAVARISDFRWEILIIDNEISRKRGI